MKYSLCFVMMCIVLFLGCRSPQKSSEMSSSKSDDELKQTQSIQGKLKVAFLYIAPIGDYGWTWAHDQGRQKMLEACNDLIEQADYEESVPDDAKATAVIEKYAKAGYHLIFTTSFGHMNPTLDVAKRYPNTIFMHCSGHKTHTNMGNYFGRIYEPDYLSGLVAGNMTKSNKIGYVAPHPIPEVIRGINAFTIGVRQVNPQAKVYVKWTHAWYNPEEARACAEALMALQGVDIMAQGEDSPSSLMRAQEEGILGIGYNTNMQKYAPQSHLTSPMWDWAKIYIPIVRSVKEGTWKNEAMWWGMETGLVKLAPLSDKVPAEVSSLVERQSQAILAKSFAVFSGPLKNQTGEIIVGEGQEISDADKLKMKYFVEGVVGDIPPAKGLKLE